jgi:ABC-type nitrate/sulfonate/bicarbonate transport system permease component
MSTLRSHSSPAAEPIGRPATRRPRKVARRKELSLRARVACGCTGFVLLPVAWQVLSDTKVINPVIWASPTKVWTAFISLINQGLLGPDCWQSLEVFLWGFGIALVSGIVIGITLGWYRRASAVLDPWVSMLYAVPRVGLIPIIVAGAGIAMKSQIIVVWISAVFPIIVNVAVGVNAIDRDYLRTAQSFLATNRDVLLGVAIPGSLPLVFAGIRQGFVGGLIGVVIAEYVLGNGGVGGLIVTASAGSPAEAFVGAFIFALFAVTATALLRLLERRVSRWR